MSGRGAQNTISKKGGRHSIPSQSATLSTELREPHPGGPIRANSLTGSKYAEVSILI